MPSYMIETNGNFAILKLWKLLSLLNFELDLKFYFLHMKSDEVGTTLKHPETIKKMKVKENATFTLRI